MEKWQKDFITERLPFLVHNINCHVNLLCNLTKYGVLSAVDVSTLTALGKLDGEHAKAHKLLEILCTRQKAYEHLAKSLYNSKQTGTLLTLLHGVEMHIPHQSPFKYCGIELNSNELLSMPVLFQGASLPLSQACSSLAIEHLQKVLQENIDAVSYKQFLDGESIPLAIDTIPKQIPFFIPRSLSMTTEVEACLFEELPGDVFLIEGLEMHQLTLKFTKRNRNNNSSNVPAPDKSSNQIYNLTANIILLEHHDHFNEIADQSAYHVHWLKCEEGRYHYVRSNSGKAVSRIKKFIKNCDPSTVISQKDFIQKLLNNSKNNYPVILYDSPGMGKSVLLAELAREVKSLKPRSIVIFVSLSELISQMNEAGGNFHAAAFKRSLQEIVSGGSRFSGKIMKELFDNTSHQIIVFLDGFDELHDKDIQAAAGMLKCVSEECKNIWIFITTRPHCSDQLESLFGVLGYNILPFSEEDQVSFFTKYWTSQHGVIATNELREFAKRCLAFFTKQLSSDERDIAGIPLQCRMLAEIYSKNAKVGDSSNIESEHRVNSIYKMYKEYVHMRFQSACEVVTERHSLYKYHVNLAIHLLFPEHLNKIPGNVNMSKAYTVGILEPSQNDLASPNFVHRTFAEFMAAEHLATLSTDEGTEQNDEVVVVGSSLNLFLGLALTSYERYMEGHPDPTSFSRSYFAVVTFRQFIFPVVVKFLNYAFADSAQNTPSRKLKTALERSHYFTPVALSSLFFASLTSNVKHFLLYILNLYLNLDYDRTTGKLLFENFSAPDEYPVFLAQLREFDQLKMLLEIASLHSSVDLVKLAYEFLHGICWKGLADLDLTTSVKLAVSQGRYQVFNFLRNLSDITDSIDLQPLLYECLHYSYEDEPDVIVEKIQIIKLILEETPELVNKSYYVKKVITPVLCTPKAHFQLIKCLIEAGAEASSATTARQQNICHLLAVYLSDNDYHQLVELMLAKNLKSLLVAKNAKNESPAHVALFHIELKLETLQLFSKCCQVSFNDATADYGSELAYAIAGGRSRQVLENVVALEGNWRKLGFDVNVISLAIENNNVDALKYFLSLGADPNKRCNLLAATPLSVALEESNNKLDVVEILVEGGVNVNALFLQSYFETDNTFKFRWISPLRYANEHREINEEVKRILVDNGAQICKIKSLCVTTGWYCFCFPCLTCLGILSRR